MNKIMTLEEFLQNHASTVYRLLKRHQISECLTSLADDLTHYALC
jgi:hypothetical protein